MPRPPILEDISLGALFPLLVSYFAALSDNKYQGEYSLDWDWPSLMQAIDMQSTLRVTPSQLKHLFYNYELMISDHRYPRKGLDVILKNYWETLSCCESPALIW
jgi:hypothetical protein